MSHTHRRITIFARKLLLPALAALLLSATPLHAHIQPRDTALHAADHLKQAAMLHCAGGEDRDEDEGFFTSLWLLLRHFIFPQELNLIYDLRAWIAELPAPGDRTREGDLRRTDEIYDHAVYLAEGDAARAILACAWATLPYHTFPARIPLLDIGITVPVSTESRAVFDQRMKNLPGKLFEDSPRGLDRDKVPHFFGSAWLQLATRQPMIAEAAGELLELSEAVFKLEGSRDPRDIAVNRLGVCFAIALQRQQNIHPSDILKRGLQHHEHCAESENSSR